MVKRKSNLGVLACSLIFIFLIFEKYQATFPPPRVPTPPAAYPRPGPTEDGQGPTAAVAAVAQGGAGGQATQ